MNWYLRNKKKAIVAGVIVLSIGYYGIKGGIFTIKTGGVHLVLGPDKSFISTRGEIATALNMTIPLMRYLQLTTRRMWIKHGLTVAMILSLVAIFGTHSRGGFLGLAAMALFLIMKTRKKILLLAVLIITYWPDLSMVLTQAD